MWAPGTLFWANHEFSHQLLSLLLKMAPHSHLPTTLRPLTGLFSLPLTRESLAVTPAGVPESVSSPQPSSGLLACRVLS